LTALAMSGGLAVSVSCGGGGDGGSAGGGGGGGGSGGSGGGGESTCNPGPDEICFASNKAQGLMGGYAFLAVGSAEDATSPVCDNTANGGQANEKITAAKPCPESGGKSVWSTKDSLCMSGTIPKVQGGDYTGNWGMQVGWNASDPAGSTMTPAGSYTKITFTWTGTIDPANTAIRGEIHRKGDSDQTNYCATIRSGEPATLTGFNTKCWDSTGVYLTADDLSKIDKMGVQISSDDKKDYTVTDFCVQKVVFSQ
jgi:hypothetical protein